VEVSDNGISNWKEVSYTSNLNSVLLQQIPNKMIYIRLVLSEHSNAQILGYSEVISIIPRKNPKYDQKGKTKM